MKGKEIYLDVEAYLTRKERETPPTPPKLDGEQESKIIALACSKPPEGYAKWSVRLLAGKSVELGFVRELSHTTVQRL